MQLYPKWSLKKQTYCNIWIGHAFIVNALTMGGWKRPIVLRTKSSKQCFGEITSTFTRTRALGLPTVSFFIFLISCTLKAATEEKCAALCSRKASVAPRGRSLRLVLNSPVTTSLSSVWGHCLLSQTSNCQFCCGRRGAMPRIFTVSRRISMFFLSTVSRLWIACSKMSQNWNSRQSVDSRFEGK